MVDIDGRRRLAHREDPVAKEPSFGTTPLPPAPPPQSSSPEINSVGSALAHERQKASSGTVSGPGFSTRPQAEMFSYFLLDHGYSDEVEKAPNLLQWLLEYCDEKKKSGGKAMQKAATAVGKSLAQTEFLLFRELLRAFRVQGLRGGARLEL